MSIDWIPYHHRLERTIDGDDFEGSTDSIWSQQLIELSKIGDVRKFLFERNIVLVVQKE